MDMVRYILENYWDLDWVYLNLEKNHKDKIIEYISHLKDEWLIKISNNIIDNYKFSKNSNWFKNDVVFNYIFKKIKDNKSIIEKIDDYRKLLVSISV